MVSEEGAGFRQTRRQVFPGGANRRGRDAGWEAQDRCGRASSLTGAQGVLSLLDLKHKSTSSFGLGGPVVHTSQGLLWDLVLSESLPRGQGLMTLASHFRIPSLDFLVGVRSGRQTH